ncbi:MAG: F0F1 ATP synthase subunit B [Bacteroidota bacterium]
MLDLNPGLIIWTAITFLILLFLLRKIAWKPLLNALQSREEKIQSSLERAEKAKEEAERLLEENRTNLQRAEYQAHQVIREGRAVAEKLKNEILEKANASSRRMIEQAKEEIQREKEVALAELRREVVDLAIQVASKILGEELDERHHRKVVEDFLRELPKN